MKTTITTLLVAVLAISFFSCSKRITSGIDNDKYKKYSQQLEMNYSDNNSTLSASAKENDIMISNTDSRFETAVVAENKAVTETKPALLKSRKIIRMSELKELVKSNPLHKIVVKKAEGPQDEKQAQVASGRLKTGIILGAVGLLLLITAGFFGAASPVIYVVGAVLFVVGVVLILIDVL